MKNQSEDGVTSLRREQRRGRRPCVGGSVSAYLLSSYVPALIGI
jgi:hypothetical protein